MSTDPRVALDRLVAALGEHLAAAQQRRSEKDPGVEAAYRALSDAFEAYDDALYDAYDEVTPFVIYDDLDDTDDDDDDDDFDDDDEDIDEDDLDVDDIDGASVDDIDLTDDGDDTDDDTDEDEGDDVGDDVGAYSSRGLPETSSRA